MRHSFPTGPVAISFLTLMVCVLPVADRCLNSVLGAETAGRVHGRVTIGIEGASLSSAGPLVVFLDARDGKLSFEVPAEVPQLDQKNAAFAPPFLLITAGQTAKMSNDDPMLHNVFSYSVPNQFDLGLYPQGESKLVTFRTPGVVRIYCSIHANMSAIIFVAPSPYHAIVDSAGRFEIEGVQPGQYRLKTWSEKLPDAERLVEVASGKDLEVEIDFRATGAERAGGSKR